MRRAREAEESLQPKFRGLTIDQWKTANSHPATQTQRGMVALTVRHFLRDYFLPNGKTDLLLYGPPGVGKTHLAVTAFRDLVRAGLSGMFVDYQTLIASIAESWKSGDNKLAKRAKEVDVLLIDDLGAQRPIDWAKDAIQDIVTIRYARPRASIIATTNLPLELGPIGVRSLPDIIGLPAFSRLTDAASCVIVDMRPLPDFRKDRI
jgi:DNA replication protein DnaC